jgi:hypothetical protein
MSAVIFGGQDLDDVNPDQVEYAFDGLVHLATAALIEAPLMQYIQDPVGDDELTQRGFDLVY